MSAAGARRLPAAALDGPLERPKRLKLDIEEHFVYTDDGLRNIELEGRRVSRVRVIRKIINLLICGALRVGLPDKGAALQVGDTPGYILRLVRKRDRDRSGVALCVVLCHAYDTGTEVYFVLVVDNADDFPRPKPRESVFRETVEVDSPYLIGNVGLGALP